MKYDLQHPGKPEKKHLWGILLFAAAVLLMAALLLRYLTPAGCGRSDLSPVPETDFMQHAVRASAKEQKPTQQKIVCLTFDDGPSKVTPRVLDTLSSEGVPATFFVMAADNNKNFLPLVKRELAEGHQVALHSGSHEYSQIYADTGAFWQDIKSLRAALSDYMDTDSLHYLRFPGGSTNTVSRKYGGSDIMKRLKAQAKEKGYRYVDWNVCANDAVGGHPSAQTILQNIIADVGEKPVCVVLMHDTAATGNTAEALPDIIAWFRESGYTFCTVEEMDARTAEDDAGSAVE